MRLAGKRAVITGGSSGIGLRTAKLFIDNGARVVIMGRDPKRLALAVTALGAQANPIAVDVAHTQDLCNAMRQANEQLEGFDILFANAGVSRAPPIEETTEKDFDSLMNVNLKGTFFSTVYALPYLREGASIVLTGSVAGRKGRPGDPLYAASKGAVRSFGRTLAVDEGILKRNIRVNVVTPGATVTPLTHAATRDIEVRKFVADMVPMGRWGTSREVAKAVLFLGSDDSSYITGSEITVDGGLSHV